MSEVNVTEADKQVARGLCYQYSPRKEDMESAIAEELAKAQAALAAKEVGK